MTQPTPSLARFLLERITEDEAAARDAMLPGEYWHFAETAAGEVLEMAEGEGCAGWGIEHFKRHMPERVLAECEAKRRIVDAWRHESRGRDEIPARTPVAGALFWVMEQVAAPYADHPDYRQEWAV